MRALVASAVERGGLPVDDVLALTLPLLRQVQAVHEGGQVAPLRGLDALRVAEHALGFDPADAHPGLRHPSALRAAEEPASGALDVRRGADRRRDLSTGTTTDEVDVDPAGPRTARIVAGWQRWEHLVDHHDQLTDIGSLGELLAALCCGLDLTDHGDAAQLARHHRNLFALAPTLHPVVAAVLTSMLEPRRHLRAQDLGDVTLRLATYRDQPEDFDLARVLADEGRFRDRREAVLTHLRDRLFDLTRRNPLLHFRPTQRTLNLTEASVPLVLDVRSVRAEQLFTWGGKAAERLVDGKPVDVGSVVRWDDAPYAAASLDAIISTARRDRAEYGQDQLRLVTAFLRWQDVKGDPGVVISSPLVLAPVTLAKQRGVRDSYRLQLVTTEAEVNPVLRQQLRELYGFTLPTTVDLADPDALTTLRATIEQQARASQPGVTVTLLDRPRIELIRSRAETALQSYRRRRSTGRPVIGRRQYAYSYTHPGWVPLGVQVFKDRVLRAPLPVAVELGDAPVPRQAVIEQETFSIDTQGDGNPYAWELDLCAVTLANFNYRTLSLVRDYDSLLAEPAPHAAFDELFSTAARDVADPGTEIEVEDRYLVVPADDSQLSAIAQARAGDNFVIQGPPGTGKSQTITNLIADYLARGRRVLFICQKRAALDVVHARLRSQGLDEVCTLVHDSQADKKAFVHALRDTYERWLSPAQDLADLEAARSRLTAELARARAEIGALEQALTTGPAPRLVDLVDRLVALRESHWGTDLPPAEQRLLPLADEWREARSSVDALAAALARHDGEEVLGRSPARHLDPACLADPRVDALVAERAATVAAALDDVRRRLGGGPEGLTLAEARAVGRLHELLDPLAQRGRLDVLRQRSADAVALRELAAAHEQAARVAQEAAAAAAGWREPLAPDDARAALEVARAKERSVWRFLSGDWRRVRDAVASGYADPRRQVPPTTSEALTLLVARHDAEAALAGLRAEAETSWGHPDLAGLDTELVAVRREGGAVGAWRDLLVTADDRVREELDELAGPLATIDAAAAGVLHLDGTLEDLGRDLAVLATPAGQALVRAVAPALRELVEHPQVLAAVRRLDAGPDQLEHAVLAAELERRRAAAPALDTVDGPRLADLLAAVGGVLPRLQEANARVVIARLRDRFAAAVDHSQRSVQGMSREERATKAVWVAGRRVLEHEFGKVRAYKSIRQLTSTEPGTVVGAMRPVWLMSPASLSDVLPLESAFDVVIYDEASQVPVEEAVPALHRAGQVIVVGDRMQLPPTTYFQTRVETPDEDDDDPAQVGVVLDADSFLAVSSVRLPSTMLRWHYRSRYEALIQFSNAAFYEGRLATIPDRQPATALRPLAVTVGDGIDETGMVDDVLARSISLVRVEDGVYTQRTNPAEATWIAAFVRDLLRRGTGLTVGIVAFSEAQQNEIERALERLSADDPDFAAAYEAELVREEDGQGVGLFVKNLENVQGDERDVIVMSVCYAPGPDGRMRMSFGPINNAGGEKRLNVIFSRAKRHMVLVSSIDHTAITNTYNDGANTLKGFLRYAGAVSAGDEHGAATVLRSLREREAQPTSTDDVPVLVAQLTEALRGRGIDVAPGVGQSGFRCDLALRRPGAPAYAVAVLVDHPARIDGGTPDERRLTQPAVLSSAGWRVEQVVATEWLERPDAVVDRLVAALAED
ncbi:AAA domain-containing protein [Nocardioides sp. 503]|uniref:AAA domain-containing protein n=1 Tax=Nocardioides sp. 503 TaxID=2508326 RepID=UPI00106F2A9A|nr:AAA domain-containing protein [Nocardioides sp. 503]